jgi:hypothetical protein
VVTQTTARFGFRPVANAFGTSASAIATAGLGRSDNAHRRSTTPCSCGASGGVTIRPPIAYSAMRSENQYWANSRPPAITTTSTGDRPAPIRTAMKAT